MRALLLASLFLCQSVYAIETGFLPEETRVRAAIDARPDVQAALNRQLESRARGDALLRGARRPPHQPFEARVCHGELDHGAAEKGRVRVGAGGE